MSSPQMTRMLGFPLGILSPLTGEAPARNTRSRTPHTGRFGAVRTGISYRVAFHGDSWARTNAPGPGLLWRYRGFLACPIRRLPSAVALIVMGALPMVDVAAERLSATRLAICGRTDQR